MAENSTKNVNHSFTVITPFQQIVLAAASRKEMEEWVGSFKMAVSRFKNAVSCMCGWVGGWVGYETAGDSDISLSVS